MSNATLQVKKQLRGWGASYYITEYLPITGGLITAMIINPSVWAWLIFILLFVLIIGLLIAFFMKSSKTIIWGAILVLILAINGLVMYLVVGVCFLNAAINDIFITPKYSKLKNKYIQFKNQDEYEELNK